jgi:hypothetical protein
LTILITFLTPSSFRSQRARVGSRVSVKDAQVRPRVDEQTTTPKGLSRLRAQANRVQSNWAAETRSQLWTAHQTASNVNPFIAFGVYST